MNFEEREIKTLVADFAKYDDWVAEHEVEIMSELIEAAEEIVLDELEEAPVVNVELITPFGSKLDIYKLYRKDIPNGLKKIMEKCIDLEEYELCQRILDVQEYIKDEVDDL